MSDTPKLMGLPIVESDNLVTSELRFVPASSEPVLTISPDGRLTFGKHAHPQEVVDILMRYWEQARTACTCAASRVLHEKGCARAEKPSDA